VDGGNNEKRVIVPLNQIACGHPTLNRLSDNYHG
jgi:hypothetical protein